MCSIATRSFQLFFSYRIDFCRGLLGGVAKMFQAAILAVVLLVTGATCQYVPPPGKCIQAYSVSLSCNNLCKSVVYVRVQFCDFQYCFYRYFYANNLLYLRWSCEINFRYLRVLWNRLSILRIKLRYKIISVRCILKLKQSVYCQPHFKNVRSHRSFPFYLCGT